MAREYATTSRGSGRTSAPARAITLLLVALMSACGGGSQTDPSPIATPVVEVPRETPTGPIMTVPEVPIVVSAPQVPVLETGPVHAFLSIEERAGKRVLDAWFVATPTGAEAALESSMSNSRPMSDQCRIVSATDLPSASLAPFTRAADAIELVSRSGVQVRLDYFAFTDSVVYAPEQRWLREPIADDTQVTLIGNPLLEAQTPPMLSSVQTLELRLPRRPVLDSAGTSLQWQPSVHPADRIVLTVWPKSRAEDNAHQPTLECTLLDDGHFTLAESMPESPAHDDGAYGFRLKRERRTEHQVDGLGWSIVQSSLAHF